MTELDAFVPLGRFPTPVHATSLRPGLWWKDDGACSALYGGNKVRKLEYLLWRARPRLVTFGVVGSHHVLATALHGRELGHEVEAVVLGRPWSAHAEEVHRATLPVARLWFEPDFERAKARFAELSAGATSIPAGGSDRTGALGWVRAGFELAGQVRAGELPEPARIFVPYGTAATAAGLQEGLRRAGLRSRVIGVRVVPVSVTADHRAGELGDPVEIDDQQLGEGYGVATDAALAAARLVPGLETTYTAKALAAALAAEGGPDLFWNTVSTVPLPPAAPFDPAAWGW